jgi:hypothetical protein
MSWGHQELLDDAEPGIKTLPPADGFPSVVEAKKRQTPAAAGN